MGVSKGPLWGLALFRMLTLNDRRVSPGTKKVPRLRIFNTPYNEKPY